MLVEEQITRYLNEQDASKKNDLLTLHDLVRKYQPGLKLWFFDGKNEEGKSISNPNIGYGSMVISSEKVEQKEFYQVGISANTVGISVYILAFKNNDFLKEKYASIIGKATVSRYCIKFKNLESIDLKVLMAAISDGLNG